MKESVSHNLNRLSLHDSNIENIVMMSSDLILEFDWCGLTNYTEKKFDEVIIIYSSKLHILNYRNDTFKLSYGGTPGHERREPDYISFTEFRRENFNPVLKSTINDDIKLATLEGFWPFEDLICWLEWSFNYDSMALEWDNFITRKEWLNGKKFD